MPRGTLVQRKMKGHKRMADAKSESPKAQTSSKAASKEGEDEDVSQSSEADFTDSYDQRAEAAQAQQPKDADK